MFKLPVSGLSVTIRQPTGREDLLLQEPQSSALATCLALAKQLAEALGNEQIDWSELTITDLETLMLLMRQATLGNAVRAETHCVRSDCGARVDVDFRVNDYLRSRKPRIPRGIEREARPGWFQVVGETARFRLPRCKDLVGIQSTEGADDHARLLLAGKCIEPPDAGSRLRSRIERAMQAIAAPLSGNLAGTCPECDSSLSIYFDVLTFVLREMRAETRSIYQDVHLLALHYKWPEEKILALPRQRRLNYAEMIRSERSAA